MSESPRLVVGVPTQTEEHETRVAIVPASVQQLVKLGCDVRIENDCGRNAGFDAAAYEAAGATVCDRDMLLSESDILAGVSLPWTGEGCHELQEGQIVVGCCDPLWESEKFQTVAERNIVTLALELLPRITRAQSMDILSSMATCAGYKAVILAAQHSTRLFPMLMTAAGTVKPARVLVIGAGVAGLQAIATARRLGAVVSGYDVRPAVKEQVESLGAKFIELDLKTADSEQAGGYAKEMDEDFYERQREMMTKLVAESDVVITTAAIPGKQSPLLITKEMVDGMQPGSVIVDLAAERGGNCEVTLVDARVDHLGVTVLGPSNLAATVPLNASEMYSRNMTNFLGSIIKDGAIHLDLNDEIIAGTLVTHEGQIVHPRIRALLEMPPLDPPEPEPAESGAVTEVTSDDPPRDQKKRIPLAE